MKTASATPKVSAYAWLVFFLSACFLFYKYILQVSPSVMSAELMRDYSLTGTALGFLVGFYFYTYLIMQIPSGILLIVMDPIKSPHSLFFFVLQAFSFFPKRIR